MKMFQFLTGAAIAFLLLPACFAADLDDAEKKTLSTLAFDAKIARELKNETGVPFAVLTTTIFAIDPETRKYAETTRENPGITFGTTQAKAETAMRKYSRAYREKGYVLFISEMGFSSGTCKLSALKTGDQFDVLEVMQTDGINYDLDNAAVTATLRTWNARYPFRISGAGPDWVEAEFLETPRDLAAFAREVYEFCPDIVDQGTGTVKALAKEMARTGKLFLWWD